MSCNELLVWVQVLSGLAGRWTGVMDAMLSSIAPEVTQISQNFQKGVMEHNKGTGSYHILRACGMADDSQ